MFGFNRTKTANLVARAIVLAKVDAEIAEKGYSVVTIKTVTRGMVTLRVWPSSRQSFIDLLAVGVR